MILCDAIENHDEEQLMECLLESDIKAKNIEYEPIGYISEIDISFVADFLLNNPHPNTSYMISNVISLLHFKEAQFFMRRIQEKQPTWSPSSRHLFARMYMTLDAYEENKNFIMNLGLTIADFVRPMLANDIKAYSMRPYTQGTLRWFTELLWNNFNDNAIYRHLLSNMIKHEVSSVYRPVALILNVDKPQTPEEETFLMLYNINPEAAKNLWEKDKNIHIEETTLYI